MALRSVPVAPLTRGARLLRAHLEKADISVPAFCEAHGLDRHEIQRLINGSTVRVAVDLALAVMKAAPGVCEVKDFASDTLPKVQVRTSPRKGSGRSAGPRRTRASDVA